MDSSVIITHTHLTTTTKVHHTRTRRNFINYNLSDDDNSKDEEDGDEGKESLQNKSVGSWHGIHKIIDEKRDKYRILWAGVNPKTSRPWPADWIRRSEVSAPAIAEWEKYKRAKALRQPSTHTPRRARPLIRKPLPSSTSDYQPSQSVTGISIDNSFSAYSQNLTNKHWKGAIEGEEEEIENNLDTNLLRPASSARVFSEAPLVELSQKSTSFDRTEYLVFSELSSSQLSSQQLRRGEGNSRLHGLASPCQTHPPEQHTEDFPIDRVIPDSQPSFPSSVPVYSPAERTLAPSGIVIENSEENDDTEDLIGAQPRSQCYREAGDCFTDFLGPLLHTQLLPHTEPPLELSSTADECLPLISASQTAELDTTAQNSIIRSPGSLSLSAGNQTPPLTFLDYPMAEQSLHSPPLAGQQTPATGRLSLREKLAQSRRGFNDAVSAFMATPTRTEVPPNKHSQSPALSARPPTMLPHVYLSKSAGLPVKSSGGQAGNNAPKDSQHTNDMSAGQSPPDLVPSIPTDVLHNSTNNQPSVLVPQSQSSNFTSQLRLSLSNLLDGDLEYTPSQSALSQISTYSPLPDSPSLSSGEHVVAVGLSDDQKHAYLQNITNKGRIIQEFCGRNLGAGQAVEEVFELLAMARRISTHLDLATTETLSWEQHDLGYALRHPKFQFLNSFFDAIRYHSLSIAILAEPGKTLDILELFLRSLKIRCRRTDSFNTVPALLSNEIDGSINVLLAPTGPEGSRVLGGYASLVIGLDSTFNTEDTQVERFRVHALEVGRRAPILRLVAANTVEHVKLFLPSQKNHYLPQLMSYVAILRHQAGSLPAAYTDELKSIPKKLAKFVGETFEPGSDLTLEIPSIPGLPIYEVEDLLSCKAIPCTVSLGSTTGVNRHPHLEVDAASPGSLTPGQHAGDKRRWDESSQEPQVRGPKELSEKKRKVANAAEDSEAGDITHISDSQPALSQVLQCEQEANSMDIDQPKQQLSQKPGVTIALAQDSDQNAVSAQGTQDSVISLAIREQGYEEITSPQNTKGQNAEELSGFMEGVTCNEPVTPTNASQLAVSKVISQGLNEPKSTEPDTTPDAIPQITALNDGVAENQGKLPPPDATGALTANFTGDSENRNEIPGINDTEIEYDDFEYPSFEKPTNLLWGAKVEQLDREKLLELLKVKHQELDTWVHSTSRLQFRFEEMRKEMQSLRAQLRRSKNLEIESQGRMTRLNMEVTNLKDDRRQLNKELQHARTALLSSDSPDLVKTEELRIENAKLKDEISSMGRQLESAKSEVQWARAAYQTATREGGDRSKEATELRQLNEELERKADERAVKLREIQLDNQRKIKDQQIDKLKHILVEREERIRRLEGEKSNIAYKGGRPLGTRATSVPRRGSPNTSRTSSPGPGTMQSSSTVLAPATRPFHLQTVTRRSNKE